MVVSPIYGLDSKWAATCQNQQSDRAPSADSDQPWHPPSLIRVFAVRMKKAWVLSYPLSASEDFDQTGRMPRLIWVFAGRTLILLVLSCRGSNGHLWENSHGSLYLDWTTGDKQSILDGNCQHFIFPNLVRSRIAEKTTCTWDCVEISETMKILVDDRKRRNLE